MTDIDRRLRSEAAGIVVPVPAGLGARIRTAVAAAPSPPMRRTSPPRPWAQFVAAAAFAIAATLAWGARPAATAAVVPVPSPSGLVELLRSAAPPPGSGPGQVELGALGEDLAAAARTVRGAIPF